MPTLTLTNEQVIELVKQLPNKQQLEIFRFLLLQQWKQCWQMRWKAIYFESC